MPVKPFRLVVCLVGASLLNGCATRANYARAVLSWKGAVSSTLTDAWGYPDRIKSLVNGHKLYVYRREERGQLPVVMTPGYTSVQTRDGVTTVTSMPPTLSGGGSYDLRCKTWFEVNRHSRIVKTQFRGNNCVGTDDFVKQFSHRAK